MYYQPHVRLSLIVNFNFALRIAHFHLLLYRGSHTKKRTNIDINGQPKYVITFDIPFDPKTI